MRVIGGRLKRRKLLFPKTFETRPVTDRAKETIFNVLGNSCQGREALDLFAGSGSLGIEALSRGAKRACFVETAQSALRCIQRNLELLSLKPLAHILPLSVSHAIRKLELGGQKFNLIFLDPPHNKGLIKKMLNHLDHSDIVADLGRIIVGHSNREGLPEGLKTLKHERSIKIGQTFVSFLTKVVNH